MLLVVVGSATGILQCWTLVSSSRNDQKLQQDAPSPLAVDDDSTRRTEIHSPKTDSGELPLADSAACYSSFWKHVLLECYLKVQYPSSKSVVSELCACFETELPTRDRVYGNWTDNMTNFTMDNLCD